MSDPMDPEGAKGPKKALQDMSQDELIKKCKGLLLIAQKAKSAKDDAVKEVEGLRAKADQAEALEEMVKSLSEQKVNFVTEIEQLKKKNNDKLTEVETTCLVQQRQLKRLENENEDLLLQVDSLDQALNAAKVEVIQSAKIAEKLQEYEVRLAEKIAENQDLNSKLSNVEEHIQLMKKNLAESEDTVSTLTAELGEVQRVKSEQAEKIQAFRDQINASEAKYDSEQHELAAKMSSYEEKIQLLEHCLIERENVIVSLNSKNSDLETKEEICSNEIVKLRAQIEHLTLEKKDLAENPDLKDEISKYKKVVLELEQNIAEKNDAISRLNQGKSQQLSKFDELEAVHANEKADLTYKISALENQRTIENQQFVSKISSFEDQVKSLEEALEQKDNAMTNLAQELNQHLSKIADLENESKTYSVEKANLKSQIQTLEEKGANESRETDVKLAKMEEQGILLEQDLAKKEVGIRQLETLVCNLRTAIADQSQKDDEEASEKALLLEQVRIRNMDIEELRDQISSYQEQVKLSEQSQAERENTIRNLSNQITDLVAKQEQYSSEKNKLVAQIQDLTLKNKGLADNHESSIQSLKQLQNEQILAEKYAKMAHAKDLESQIHSLLADKAELERTIQHHEFEMSKDKVDEIESLQVQLRNAESEKDKVLQENEQLMNDLKVQNAQLSIKEEQLSNFQSKFTNDCSAMKKSLQCLLQNCNETKSSTLADIQGIREFLKMISTKADEQDTHKNELLDEIREVNAELKKRGAKIANYEEEKKSDMREVSSLKQQLQDLHLNTSKSSVVDEGISEAMSTSTVSKVEETARMADVENSFEDRYTKLKAVAIKLKKKANEQEKLIAELQQSKDSQLKIGQLSTNFANLQAEYDKAQDTNEALKKEVSGLTKDMKATMEALSDTKIKLADYEVKLASAEAEKEALESNLSNSNEQISNLTSKTSDQERKIELLVTENQDLSSELKSLKTKLDAMSGMDKKHDLLDLELEEAEARITSLTSLYEQSMEEANQLKSRLELETETRQNREMQIAELEQTLEKESERASDLKAKLIDARSTLSSAEMASSESKCEFDALVKEMDKLRSDNEKLACELAEISGSAVHAEKTLKSRNESLQKMVHLLEADLDRKKATIEELEGKLSGLEQDFDSYKVRAQSVLRQAKEKDTTIGAKAQELASLERVNQNLNEKIADMSTQMAASDLELRHVQEDHDRLMERHSALLTDMASKERQSREKLEQLVKLANAAEKGRQDAIASLQEQTEILRQNYRSQMEELESKHVAEVAKLQKQVDDLDNQIIRLQMANNCANPKSSTPAHDVVNYLEREAAEGSEAVEASSANRATSATPTLSNLDPGHGRFSRSISRSEDAYSTKLASSSPLVPLEQLLLRQESDFYPGSSASPTTVLKSEAAGEGQVRALAAERRVSHMASLLSEAEAENARLRELANVLKEEIRSYQRSEERSKHIENLEYVKNVIIKFVTMPGSDEKSRLIPVLSTILRLSPAEVESIQKVVASDMAEANNSSDEVGWTSYLGLWSN